MFFFINIIRIIIQLWYIDDQNKNEIINQELIPRYIHEYMKARYESQRSFFAPSRAWLLPSKMLKP